ncbi:MAG: aldo/keto reductase [Eggerthellaceae bacterium]
MNYRRLGKTDLMVSEIGFGAEWMEDKPVKEVVEITHRFAAAGVNILDCWMPNPEVRSALGEGIKGQRDRWIIQGHIGATWQGGQYVRTRDMDKVRPAFEDLLARLGTDHVELGMIHYVDDVEEFERVVNGEFMTYVRELKVAGAIEHVGLFDAQSGCGAACRLPGRGRSHHVQRESRLRHDACLGKPR